MQSRLSPKLESIILCPHWNYCFQSLEKEQLSLSIPYLIFPLSGSKLFEQDFAPQKRGLIASNRVLYAHGGWTNGRIDLLYYGRIDYGRAHNSYNWKMVEWFTLFQCGFFQVGLW